jgi:NTP pyrophosphatase (non-canonical NTP hydrolase)
MNTQGFQLDEPSIITAGKILQDQCHGAAAHWWIDPKTGIDIRTNPMCFSQKLMLIVSELAEAMEGDRKNLMDDKLPHREMREVELADAVIRIFDTAGGFGMDLGNAIAEKMQFNAHRPDHKVENRLKDDGKKY